VTILTFKTWYLVAPRRRADARELIAHDREPLKLAPRRPDYEEIARLERELGISTDSATERRERYGQ
jgi:signal recognition particle subunit SEC65